MKLSDKQWEFLKDVCLLIQFAERKGWKLTGGELWRMAIDFNLFIDGKFKQLTEDHRELGEFWESIRPENRWGGHWNDGNYYERKD